MTDHQRGESLPNGQDAPATDAEKIRQDLEKRRERRAAKAEDRLTRFREKATWEMGTRAIRQDLTRDRTMDALTRAKAAADIAQSAEARALRVQRTRTLTLLVLLPVLAAFGAWSTAGVHAGAASMTGAEQWTAMWWALWLLEPALIGVVAWVILCRARLESSGGSLPEDANHIMWGCLAVSILLNTVGHWPAEMSGTAVGSLIAHSLGPIGAAGTAHLIGVIERGITTARPTEGAGVKTLSELTSDLDENTSESRPEEPAESVSDAPTVDRSRWSERALEIPAGATRLHIVRCCGPVPASTRPNAPDSSLKIDRRSTPEQGEHPVSKTPSRTRADKGRKVPKSATPTGGATTSRALSDEDLLTRLDELIDSGEVPKDVSVRRLMGVLGCGFDRTKRVLTLREERTETTVSDHLSVVTDTSQENAA